jgi:hypothetical protein
MHLLFLLACQNDDVNINAGVPELALSPTSIDFGEVVVGGATEIGLRVVNEGYGTLRFDGLAFDETSSADFAVGQWPQDGVGHDEEGILSVLYAPDVEGGDAGVLVLPTNIPDAAPVEVVVEGIGVIPQIELSPSALYFGVVPPGDTATRTLRVSAEGSGNLRILRSGLSGDGASGFSVALPSDWEEPYVVTRGFSFEVTVTFSPTSSDPYEATLVFDSNDPDDATASVRLAGNTADDPDENEAPFVEVTSPNDGTYFLDDQTVSFEGYVNDAEEPPQNLLCGWFADGTRVAAAVPDADGVVTASSLLPIGNVDLELRCYDSEGLMGQDVAEVVVWDHTEPLRYTISGGDSMFDFFAVDDDVVFSVDGSSVYTDDNDTKDSLAPVAFDAERGSELRILVTDQNACDASLDALVLHWGTGQRIPLNDVVCISSCPDHACYDSGYNGPWPGIVLDETFTISIP